MPKSNFFHWFALWRTTLATKYGYIGKRSLRKARNIWFGGRACLFSEEAGKGKRIVFYKNLCYDYRWDFVL